MIKKTLIEWYAQNQITLHQAQLLSEIVEMQQVYTLAELNLLAQLPTTAKLPNPGQKFPNLTKYQEQIDRWQLTNYWQNNWPWLVVLLLLLLILILK